jgi:hypothetical protein
MTAKISWVVKGYPYSVSNVAPTTANNTYLAPYIWINSTTEIAYILSGTSVWSVRPPDHILNEGTDYQINVIERDATGTQSTGAPTDLGYLTGTVTGDLIVWNAGTNKWEVKAGGAEGIAAISTPNDGELHLTPKASSSGAEGTIFYCGDDNAVYVGVE